MGNKGKGLRWSEEEYKRWLVGTAKGLDVSYNMLANDLKSVNYGKSEQPSKYHVAPQKKRRYNGILFASVKEMDYYKDLQLLVKGGEMKFFLRQVPFDLPGGVKYRVDFVEFHPDGSVRFVDVKGVKTDMFIMKRKQVQSLYPVTIETV